MKKTIFLSILLIFIFFNSLIVILTTTGLETDRFNNLITKKISKTNNKVDLKLNTIKFKFDIRKFSLFLETKNPNVKYRNVTVPAKNIKVYINFISFVKAKTEIEKIILSLNEINIKQIKELSSSFKPSTLNSLVNNKINQGKLSTEIEFFFDKENNIKDFIARGRIENLKAQITKKVFLDNTSFTFFADKTDILVKNFYGNYKSLKIINGDAKIELNEKIYLQGNFETYAKLSKENTQNFGDLNSKLTNFHNILNIEASLKNNFTLDFDKTYRVKDYQFKSSGKILNAALKLNIPIDSSFLEKKIDKLFLKETEIKMNFNPKKNTIDGTGNYSFQKDVFQKFSLKNEQKNKSFTLKINSDFDEAFNINLINYIKPKNKSAKLLINIEKSNDNININEIKLQDDKNLISIEGVKLKKNKFYSFEKISIKTFNDQKKNNDLIITSGKKISIKGSNFDAINFSKNFNQKQDNNILKNINKEIEIDLDNITVPLSKKIKDFKLIGKIEKGEFTKISSKGSFGNGNFLDISMKNNIENKKKYLEIYSDIATPLLTEYTFFKGLTDGNLLFSSVIGNNASISKLKIEKFKVINAPAIVKLLSLADLGGLADLAEGEGLSFDVLEIDMVKTKDLLKFNEILAHGPSVSVLMEGYQNSNLTSLKGTLIPAKNLNKLISKIPVIGNIVIPKEVGEGLFGISFKMKGPPGEIKTTINPIKTITPRFIQKILNQNKKSK